MGRSYLHHTVTKGVPSASVLVTYHNVAYMQVRQAGVSPCLACMLMGAIANSMV
jgi:hypothetical protein